MSLASLPARRPLVVLALAALLTWGAVVSAAQLRPEVDFLDTVPQTESLDAYRELVTRLDGVRFSAVYMARDPANTTSLRSDEGFDALVREQEDLTQFLDARFPNSTIAYTLSAYEAMRQGNYMLVKLATAGNAPPEAYDMPRDRATYEAVRREVRDGGSADDVLADDGSSALLLVFFETKDGREARQLAGEVDAAVRDWAADAARHPVTQDHATSGLLQASHYTDQVNRAELEKWTPLAALGVAVALLLVVRRPTNALIAVTSLAVALAWTYGAMGALGVRVSFLTVFLAPVVVGVGVDYAIHLLHRYEHERDRGHAKRDAAGRALAATAPAIGLGALTTAAGLSVLLLVPAPLFAQVGGVGALGIGLGFLAAVTVAPALRVVLPEHRHAGVAPRDRLGALVFRAAVGAARRPAASLALVALLAGAAGAYAWTHTVIESGSSENEFPQDDPVIVLQQRVEREYGAFQRAYLVVRGDVATPAALRALHEAQLDAASLPLFRSASSVVDLLLADDKTDEGAVDIARSGALGPTPAAPQDADRLPASPEEARERLDRLFTDPLWRTLAPFTVTDSYDLAVVAITIEPWTDQAELRALRDALEAHAARLRDELGARYQVDAAGSPVNRASILDQTPKDVALATVGAGGVVTGILALVWGLRRGRDGLRAAAAAGAIIAVSAVLLLASVPLLDAAYLYLHERHGAPANSAALNDMFLLAFAVAVAVGVDDIVLVAHRRWEALDEGASEAEAFRRAFSEAGRSISGTTLTTAVAFGILGGAYFLQSKNLAILTALGVVYAYGATLVVGAVALRPRAGAEEN